MLRVNPCVNTGGLACPPGILVRQLSSDYRLQDIAQALISTREASEALVKGCRPAET